MVRRRSRRPALRPVASLYQATTFAQCESMHVACSGGHRLSSAIHDSTHWMPTPCASSAPLDWHAMAHIGTRVLVPSPGTSRSRVNCLSVNELLEQAALARHPPHAAVPNVVQAELNGKALAGIHHHALAAVCRVSPSRGRTPGTGGDVEAAAARLAAVQNHVDRQQGDRLQLNRPDAVWGRLVNVHLLVAVRGAVMTLRTKGAPSLSSRQPLAALVALVARSRFRPATTASQREFQGNECHGSVAMQSSP